MLMKDHEQQRKKLWCDVYVAYVSAANSVGIDGSGWADKALKRFDERFPSVREQQQYERQDAND